MAKKIILGLCIALLLCAVGTSYYFYSQWKKAITTPSVAAEQEIDTIVDVISKLMELPEDEEPTIATVIDREKLQDQAFFAKAQNDDKVLIYANARKAILYRPSTEKIIEVAPIYFEQNEQSAQTSTEDTADTSALESN